MFINVFGLFKAGLSTGVNISFAGIDLRARSPLITCVHFRRIRRQYAGGRVAAVTHGDVITFMVLWAKGYDLAPRNKTRLLQAGYPEAYPAHASITTLTYNTTDLEEKPIIAYTKP
ncbi:MAG: hypothetical protein PVH87_05350 [Desulfobacteraceae bacterium]|jgi:hypothetical protein